MPALRGSRGTFGGRIREAISQGRMPVVLAGGALLALAGSLALPHAARAQTLPCVRPIVIADRWDDVTAIPGYNGETRRTPNWQGDGVWDHEAFTDLNGNGLFDPGEPFVDGNANGRYDAEFYDPVLTGYVLDPTPGNVLAPNGDLGRAITLEPLRSGSTGSGVYVLLDVGVRAASAFDCTAPITGTAGAGRPSGSELRAIARGFEEMFAADPGARWDLATNTVVGSAFPAGSPRVFLLPLYDPRTFAGGSHGVVGIDKYMAVFLDQVGARGEAIVRLAQIPLPPPLAGGSRLDSGVVPAGAVPAGAAPASASPSGPTPATWGHLKAHYR